jgi:hypothetical protein
MSEMNMKELKAQVRELRKEHCPPVSRLKKEALKREYAHLSSLGMKSPNMSAEPMKEVAKEEVKKMPKVVRLTRPVEVKEVKEAKPSEPTKAGRKPSAYAEFVKKTMKPGMSMKQVAELYKKTKN